MINFDKEVDKCVEILKNGGIILYPTDTIYGIGCDSYNFKAMENVNKLKIKFLSISIPLGSKDKA